MTWWKADDRLPEHPKILRVGKDGLALFVRAGCYCARNLTDGFLPDAVVAALTYDMDLGASGMARIMVGAGLWEAAEGGFKVHDYLDYNPARADVLAERGALTLARSAAGRAGGFASGESRRSKQGSKIEANAKQNGSPVPDPVVPDLPPPGGVSSTVSDAPPTMPTARRTRTTAAVEGSAPGCRTCGEMLAMLEAAQVFFAPGEALFRQVHQAHESAGAERSIAAVRGQVRKHEAGQIPKRFLAPMIIFAPKNWQVTVNAVEDGRYGESTAPLRL